MDFKGINNLKIIILLMTLPLIMISYTQTQIHSKTIKFLTRDLLPRPKVVSRIIYKKREKRRNLTRTC